MLLVTVSGVLTTATNGTLNATIATVTSANLTTANLTFENLTTTTGFFDDNTTGVIPNRTFLGVDLKEAPWLFEGANCPSPPGVNVKPLPKCPTNNLDVWFDCVDSTAEYTRVKNVEMNYRWSVNLTEFNAKLKTAGECFENNFTQVTAKQAALFLKTHVTHLTEQQRRELELWDKKHFPLEEDEKMKVQKTVGKMKEIYSKAKICPPHKSDYLECTKKWSLGGIDDYLDTSNDYEGLADVWKKWRDASGKKMRDLFKTAVKLFNKGSKANRLHDYGAALRNNYEMDEPKWLDQVKHVWTQILPLYEELHTYVRSKLVDVYPGTFNKESSMPAHIFGNMWAQTWVGIMKHVLPYEDDLDLDLNMQEQNYTVKGMFEAAEQFFVSVGFPKLPASFWDLSVIEEGSRSMVCHPSAWDFYNGKDFAVKMCTKVNLRDFDTIHHELGHIYYFIEYAHLRQVFRDGANAAFHEGIGDTLSLSFYADSYLKHLNLITEDSTYEQTVNRLMHMALKTWAFFPFGYVMDLYRWKIYELEATKSTQDYNTIWWNLREQYQGIFPPVARTEKDFDPGAKFHTASNVPYIRYFVSHILIFQFHDALCKEVDPTLELHKCSIFNNTKAGNKLRETLSLGSTLPWPLALLQLTGTNKLSVEPMMKYYQPLLTWLRNENKRLGNCYGWGVEWPDNFKLHTPRCEPWNSPIRK